MVVLGERLDLRVPGAVVAQAAVYEDDRLLVLPACFYVVEGGVVYVELFEFGSCLHDGTILHR